jgi:hypothetical protein
VPLQNRVTPFSAIEAVPARGLFTGNRGCLHDDNRRLVTQGWRTPAWIVCTLTYKDVRRVVMTPRRWTELFFLDEAVAFAAGHRPCAFCRRPAFRAFVEAWASVTGEPARAPAVDAALHRDRVPPLRGGPRPTARLRDLPAGTLVTLPGDDASAWLIAGGRLRKWSHAGYTDAVRRSPSMTVTVLTPAATVTALRAGYRPVLHPTAGR